MIRPVDRDAPIVLIGRYSHLGSGVGKNRITAEQENADEEKIEACISSLLRDDSTIWSREGTELGSSKDP
jgi:hypothetical protein